MATASASPRPTWSALLEDLGAAWNGFWFSPGSVYPLAGLRILVGVLALYYVGSHSADLVHWFGRDGLLPTATVRQLTSPPSEDGSLPATLHLSYLNLLESPVEMWSAHVLGLLIIVLFTVGLFTRITGPLAAAVVLSYIHRAPMLTAQFESVLSMLLIYLAVGPSGQVWSLDAWRRLRASGGVASPVPPTTSSILANIALRLIQLHVAGLYLVMGLSQLGGALEVENPATWWRGQAIWWLIAKSETRLIDLTFLSTTSLGYVVNAWTHAIVFGELAFGLLVWKPQARPWLLALAACGWLSLAPVTGLISYCAVMLVANLAFVDLATWRQWGTRCGLTSSA